MKFEEPTIVGRTISALLYAWRLQRRCILLEPFLYHTLSEEFEDIDFSEFNVKNGEEFTQNLLFITGLTSLLIEGGNVAGLRPDDKKLITKGNRRITLSTDVEIFDAKNTGFNGQSHETTRIDSDDNFCNRVLFYESNRNGVNWRTKDFTSVSHLTDKEVLDAEYGQGIARIKTARMLKAEGLKGDYAWSNGDKKYYKSIKFDFAGREVLPRVEQKLTFKKVWEMKQIEGDAWKMWKRLISREKTWLG
jgi:hypothetical protein